MRGFVMIGVYMYLMRFAVNGVVLACRACYMCSVVSAVGSQEDQITTRHQKHELERFAKNQPNDTHHHSPKHRYLREALQDLPSLLVTRIGEIPVHSAPNAMWEAGTCISVTKALELVSRA